MKQKKKYNTPLARYKHEPLLQKDRRPCPDCRGTNVKIHMHKKTDGVKRTDLRCADCGRIFAHNPTNKGADEISMLSYKIPFIRPVTDTRIIFLEDTHCGHHGGYVPKCYRQEAYPLQEEYSGWVDEIINKFKPYDVLFSVGDMVEGKGSKSEGVELLTSDMSMQKKYAVELIESVGAPKIYMVSGTPYHVGRGENWEKEIAVGVNAMAFEPELMVDVNGKMFDLKHHNASSSVPHSTTSGILKQGMWLKLKEYDFDVVVRAHNHKFGYVYDGKKHYLMLPGLQYNSRFGKEIITRDVDYGIVIMDIKANGIITIQEFLKEMPRIPTYKYEK